MSARVDTGELRRHPVLADPVRLVAALGLADGARRQARGLLVRCPAHPDRTPSCSVRIAGDGTIAWHCHGCGASGDALSLVAQVHALDVHRDFRRVAELAAELAGAPLPEGERERYPEPQPPAAEPEPVPTDVALDALCATLALLGRLDGSPLSRDVTAYLEGRGLLAEARAAGWFALPPEARQPELVAWLHELAQHGGEDVAAEHAPRWTRQDLDALGWRDHIPHAGARLAIAWRGPDGTVQTVQRRRLDVGEPRYVFPAGRPPRWPYGVERLRDATSSTVVALCEGACDVLALRRIARERGVDAVPLGLPGVSAWRPAWAELLRGRRVVLALDADQAGDRATAVLEHELGRYGCRVTTEAPLGAKDWTAMLAPEVIA